MIPGAGGNSGVFITANGVVLVDTKNPNNGQGILEQVKSVTDRPVTHIINTHTHGDHNGSNVYFPATVEIVTHENTSALMQKMPAFQDAANAHGLPDRTFSDRLTVGTGNDAIDLYYFGPSHTSGDAIVVRSVSDQQSRCRIDPDRHAATPKSVTATWPPYPVSHTRRRRGWQSSVGLRPPPAC